MELIKEYTPNGFDIYYFQDDYDKECTLQLSSSIEPHIWLGVDDPKPIIRYKDALNAGLKLQKQSPETNDYGWCDFPIPEGTLIPSRMHLNQEQALILGKKLIEFGETGKL